jgi:hypothetical protein
MSPAACMIMVARSPGRDHIVRASTLPWPVGAIHQAAAPDTGQEPVASGRPVVPDTRGAVR